MPMLSAPIAQFLDVPIDQVRIVLSQVYSLILSYILYSIKPPLVRKHYSLIFGTILQLYTYRTYIYQYLFLVSEMIVVYLICAYSRRRCGTIVTVLSTLSLCSCHFYRMLTNYGGWELDISTLMMMTVCKFSLFAYQCQDGYKAGEQFQQLTEEQRNASLKTVPSFYDYICYIQFLPTAVLGPSLDYIDYSNFINRQKQYQSIPSTHRPIVQSFLEGIACVFIYQVIYRPYFPVEFMATDRYLHWNGFGMLIYSFIALSLVRFKYYFAWKLNSCSMHACGISYESTQLDYELKPEHLFTKHSNVNILNVECTVHVRQKIANWNISVQSWLRRSIYERVGTGGQLITFMVSAFWHGFYGGYYISFALWFVMVYLAQTVFRINRNYPVIGEYFEMTGFVGKAMLWLFVNVMFSNVGTYFMVLSLRISWNIMVAYKFVPVLVLVIPTIILHLSGLGRKKEGKSRPASQKRK